MIAKMMILMIIVLVEVDLENVVEDALAVDLDQDVAQGQFYSKPNFD